MNQSDTLSDRVYKEMSKILAQYNSGVRASDLVDMIVKTDPEKFRNINSVWLHIKRLHDDHPNEFGREKIKGQGTFYSLLHTATREGKTQQDKLRDATVRDKNKPSRKEKDFYAPFVEYLEYGDDDDREHLDECTKAIELGDKKIFPSKKWSNPDVIGVLKPRFDDKVGFYPEIVSAEIKSELSGNALITAFGQACSYCLFSHKVYLVIPNATEQKAFEWLKSICHIMGLGLVTFNLSAKELDVSIFQTHLRARRQYPDMYYVNYAIKGDVAKKLLA